MNEVIEKLKKAGNFLFVEKKIHKRKWFWPVVILLMLIGVSNSQAPKGTVEAKNDSKTEVETVVEPTPEKSTPESTEIDVQFASWKPIGASFTKSDTGKQFVALAWLDETGISAKGDTVVANFKSSEHFFESPILYCDKSECLFKRVEEDFKSRNYLSPDNYTVDRVEFNCEQDTMRHIAREEYVYVNADTKVEVNEDTGQKTVTDFPARWDKKSKRVSKKWQNACVIYKDAACQTRTFDFEPRAECEL